MNEKRNPQFSSQNLDGLLKAVSQKLGVPADQLRQELESGKFDKALQNMNQSDTQKFRQAVNNPQIVEKLMSTPQAKALYEKLKNGR